MCIYHANKLRLSTKNNAHTGSSLFCSPPQVTVKEKSQSGLAK